MRMFFVIFLFLLYFTSGISQIDSLLHALDSNPSDETTMEEIHTYFNSTYYRDPALSLANALKTDSLAQVHGLEKDYDRTQLMLGVAYNINEDYDFAVEHFLNAVHFANTLDHKKIEAQAYNGLAVVWQVRKDTETSTLYFHKALDIYKEIQDTLWVGLINLNLGGLYMEDELLEEADSYLEDAVIAMVKMKQPIYAGYGKLNLGSLRVKQKRYNEAITFLDDALTSVPYEVNPLIHAVGNTALGEAYMRIKQNVVAKKYLDLALDQSKKVKNYEQLEVANELMSEYYENIGNHAEALKYFKESSSLKDSFISKEEDERLIDALKKYEVEKKEQEIMLLSAENEFKDLRNERDRKNLQLALLGILTMLVLSILIIVNRNRIKKLNKTLAEQQEVIKVNLQEKELLLKEIHHRVKNNLQVISSLLNLQSSYVKDSSAITALREGKNRVKSMALIHQNLYQEGNLTGVRLKPYFEKLCRNLFDSYLVQKDTVQLELEIEDIDLDIDTVIPLGLLANELISNSLKHAFSESDHALINIQLYETSGKIHLKITDNGVGVDPAFLIDKHDSFGYQMIHAFKDKLDGEILIENNDGLSVELIFENFSKVS
ncbi:tetratricopeptide repeat-containing sensor histidine kinase [Portibacter lacus]|uniref:histidine kinase n=1 Tax=Portibacter lacus TaxID=1099794 RepID=A0AA37SWQ0_9BACT|nr:sensor histidine kinase [Portibacter lacus]GLR20181.1 hypothetical protein GCM10007940_47970 [Portibacter lacus]